MWKFQDFSVTHILREISFGDSKSSKIAIFAIFGALNLVDLVIFSFLYTVLQEITVSAHSFLTHLPGHTQLWDAFLVAAI